MIAVAVAFGAIAIAPASANPPSGINKPPGVSPASSKAAAHAPRQPGCTKRTGRGFAPSEHFARLKAWEMVAQATGNWPIQNDEFRSTTYRCRTERNGRLCLVAIDVCRRG